MLGKENKVVTDSSCMGSVDLPVVDKYISVQGIDTAVGLVHGYAVVFSPFSSLVPSSRS